MFLDLPPEIRQHVYRYVFGPRQIFIKRRREPFPITPSSSMANLLLVSRQIHIETSPFFWGQVEAVFLTKVTAVSDVAHQITASMRNHITILRFHGKCPDPNYGLGIFQNLRTSHPGQCLQRKVGEQGRSSSGCLCGCRVRAESLINFEIPG